VRPARRANDDRLIPRAARTAFLGRWPRWRSSAAPFLSRATRTRPTRSRGVRRSAPAAEALYSASTGQYVMGLRRMNFDVSTGLSFHSRAARDFDVGGTIDFKYQAELVRHFFLGVEWAYAGRTSTPATSFSKAPLTGSSSWCRSSSTSRFAGHVENPFSVRPGVAPGIQVVDPVVDHDQENGIHVLSGSSRKKTPSWPGPPARVSLRMPVQLHFGFLFGGDLRLLAGRRDTPFKDLSTGAHGPAGEPARSS